MNKLMLALAVSLAFAPTLEPPRLNARIGAPRMAASSAWRLASGSTCSPLRPSG